MNRNAAGGSARGLAGGIPAVLRVVFGPAEASTAAIFIALVTVLSLPRVIGAQSIRITGSTWIQSIDLRPLREDSVRIADAIGDGIYRTTAAGQLVRCVESQPYCRFNTSGARSTTTPLLQDLSIAAWGLGEGVSFHAQGRARSSLGGNVALWPRSGDRFDLIDAYVELDRSRLRARLGRLWALNGLGAYSFDGASVLLRRGSASLEGYGGRALVQGLNEGYTSAAIGAIEDIPPDDPGDLIGARLRLRPNAVSALSGVYQRVVRRDRAGLYSERASLDATTRLWQVTLDGREAYDIATNTVNEAQLRLTHRLSSRIDGTLEGRRRRPFFELWTIWGAFAPVGFDEGRADLTWRSRREGVQWGVHGAYRTYDEAFAGTTSFPLRSDGWRAGSSVTWLASDKVVASASYDVDIGFGSSRSDGSVGMRWTPRDGMYVGATGSAFQTIYEFRVGTGRVIGAAIDGGARLTNDLRVAADAGVYHHRLTSGAPGTDWSQRRASIRLEWVVGSDPGQTGGRRGRS